MGYIYIILNISNGKFYLGSSKFLKKRKVRHFRDLRKGKHHSIHLQRAFDKYGERSFKYIIIETSYKYLKREQELLDKIDFKDSYNVSKSASGGDMIYNHPDRKKIIEKLTIQLLNTKKPAPRFGKDNPNWKGGISNRNCTNCNKKIKGDSKMCSKCYFKQRDSSGENNPFYGRNHTEEFKRKLSKLRAGTYNGNQEREVIAEGKEFASISKAAKFYEISGPAMIYRLKSKSKKFKEFNYK